MRRLIALPLLLAPTAALAHTGLGPHGHAPFAAGLAHPLLGADHLIAMVAVGLLGATAGGRARWAFPAAFLGAMLAGGALGFGGAALPAVEPAILASVIVLGGLLALALRPPLLPACAAIAGFGLAHGYAHGFEAPALGGLAYALGFALATAALHGAGLALGGFGRPALARAFGALACLAGLALALG